MQTPQKPPYLGLLNAIALAETSAGVYLRAWAEATDDADLARTLQIVAARETSHGEVFGRRLNELGFGLKPKPDPSAEKRLAKLADPRIADVDKLPSQDEEPADPFGDIKAKLADGVFDPLSSNLLQWYITEEYDSSARLRAAYAGVRARAHDNARNNGHAPAGPGATKGSRSRR